MTVTSTEFKNNMGKYLDLASTTVIYITRNGKEVAMVTKPDTDREAILDELVGIIPEDADTDTDRIRAERLSRQ